MSPMRTKWRENKEHIAQLPRYSEWVHNCLFQSETVFPTHKYGNKTFNNTKYLERTT